MEILRPHIGRLIERIDVDEFTTVEFIEVLQLEEAARTAYQSALDRWPPRNQRLAHMIVHGQVIPQLLRESRLVEWLRLRLRRGGPLRRARVVASPGVIQTACGPSRPARCIATRAVQRTQCQPPSLSL